MVQPVSRSTFTSTVWNSPAKAKRTVNAAKYGGPNIKLREGMKVQFSDGTLIWDILRIFADGTLHLSAVSSGRRITRKVSPSSSSWENLWVVDNRGVRQDTSPITPQVPKGGGPNRTLGVGNVVVLGKSSVRWTVEYVKKDGTVVLKAFNGKNLVSTEVGPKSRFWEQMYSVNG